MPQLEEISLYLKGIWLLLTGDQRGFDYLDNSAAGVIRSFAAILWSLPAMAVIWASTRYYYLSNMPEGTSAGLPFILKLMTIDLISWIVPIALIAALAKPLAFGELLADVIVTTNWISVPLLYAAAVPAALSLMVPASGDFAALLSLIVMMVSIAAVFMLLKTITGKHTLLAFTLTALYLLPPLMAGEWLRDALGLFPV
ncbi:MULTISPECIES: hypothetical protein [unclassified Rhizobium]|uniref:hypothetical protein n=1 Tax=unclassified Rhizobium TaxID=2613769 RepID=UPI0006F442D1|nr:MULTISPECIES: hypothetical protein [unclassified Rhizobium]KQV44191.1 hypothetical protein ASC86_05285 [Rhizobium sp. Root1212]KRD38372.1 hypothetical protein ASE37_05285 [Rhizobium sp. Root268]